MKMELTILVVIIIVGLSITYSVQNQSYKTYTGNEINIRASNFTREANESWANGSALGLLPGGSFGNDVAIGDVNGDGKDEILTVSNDISWSSLTSEEEQASLRVWSYDGSSFSLLREKVWKTDGSNTPGGNVVKVFKFGGSTYILTAGMEKYGKYDGKGGIRIWKYGSSSIVEVSNVTWRDFPGKNTTVTDAFIGDVNNDGYTEIVAVGDIQWSENVSGTQENYSIAELTVWRLNSDLSLSFVTQYRWADKNNHTTAQSIAAEDYNGDGYYDMVVGGSYGFNDSGVERAKAEISIFNLVNGNIELLRNVTWIDHDSCGVMSVTLYDINHDGKDEIIAAGLNKYLVIAGEVSVWNFSLNQLARTQFYIDPEGQPGSSHWDCIANGVTVWDFDGDGNPDIVVTGLSKGPHPGGNTFWNYLAAFSYASGSLSMEAKVYWRTYDGEVSNAIVRGDPNGDGVEKIFIIGYGWKTDSSSRSTTYYAMLYSYVYQSTVPEFSSIAVFLPIITLLILATRFVKRN